MDLDPYILTAAEQNRDALRGRNLTLITIRWVYLCVLGAVGLALAASVSEQQPYVLGHLSVIAAALVGNLLAWLFARQKTRGLRYYALVGQAQILIDIALATYAVFVTAGSDNQTVILFALPIVLSGALLIRFFTYLTALLCALAYVTVTYAYTFEHPGAIVPGTFINLVIFVPLTFILIAAIVAYLSSLNMRGARQESYDELLAMLTHQLRHPVSAIAAIVDVFQGNATYKKLDSRQRQYIELIKKENVRLLSLISNLLEAARIDPEAIEAPRLTDIDLVKLLSESAHSCALGVHRSDDLTLNLPTGPLFIRADGPQLRMAFDNIINNAFLYSFVGSRVTIEMSSSPKAVTIDILDEGKGMTNREQQRLFAIFSQEGAKKSAAPVPPQAGLGLYVAKRIIERHSGTLKVTSKYREGTRVSINLRRDKQ